MKRFLHASHRRRYGSLIPRNIYRTFTSCFYIFQLSQAAISLWNVTVAKHARRGISNTSNALLRHLCYNLICCGNSNKSFLSMKKSDAKRNIIVGRKYFIMCKQTTAMLSPAFCNDILCIHVITFNKYQKS